MSLLIDGERITGQDVRTQNVTACQAIANIVKTSLGPVGLDKMLVDQIGDVTITNDGATILKQLEVEHPAAKVLVSSLIDKIRKSVTEPPLSSSLPQNSSSAQTNSSNRRFTPRL